MVVGSSVGGGYDLYGRAVARFIGNYIPGKPAVVVRNMPGAGSLTSVIFVATTAPRDGTVIGHFNPGIITDAISNPASRRSTSPSLRGSAAPRIPFACAPSGMRPASRDTRI